MLRKKSKTISHLDEFSTDEMNLLVFDVLNKSLGI